MIKLKKPNYYKLLLLLNVTKFFFRLKKFITRYKSLLTLQKIIFNVYIIIYKNKVIIASRWVKKKTELSFFFFSVKKYFQI